jgi:hypothetical protein
MFASHIIPRTLLILAIATTGCSSEELPAGEGAVLRIVGDRNVTLDRGATIELAVRYQDQGGEALAGEVELRIAGEAAGSSLSTSIARTDENGIATVRVTAGADDVTFNIVAEAPQAESTWWDVAVGDAVLPNGIDATGRYRVESHLDIEAALTGPTGDAINYLVEMTDDPNDPATFLVDIMLERTDLGLLEGVIGLVRWIIDPMLNQVILDHAPDFVTEMLEVGNMLGDVTRSFGIASELQVMKETATHTVTGVLFEIDGAEHYYSLAQIGLDNVEAKNVTFTVERNTAALGNHQLPLPLGSMVILALDKGIIPQIDPTAQNIAGLLAGLIDCGEVGDAIASQLPLISTADAFSAACDLGLKIGGTQIETLVRQLDDVGPVLELTGTMDLRDSNGDRKIDALDNGTWTGKLTMGQNTVDLSSGDNVFSGARM